MNDIKIIKTKQINKMITQQDFKLFMYPLSLFFFLYDQWLLSMAANPYLVLKIAMALFFWEIVIAQNGMVTACFWVHLKRYCLQADWVRIQLLRIVLIIRLIIFWIALFISVLRVSQYLMQQYICIYIERCSSFPPKKKYMQLDIFLNNFLKCLI